MKSPNEICIIGAGISGLSTAILLLQHGYLVSIISADDPRAETEKPEFASTFPAASIIPHSVYFGEIMPLFSISQQYFESLAHKNYPGISIYEHYELYAFENALPQYAQEMNNLELLSKFRTTWYPHHPKINAVSGWKFDCFFVDWPIYFPALLNEFFNLGGTLQIKKLRADQIEELPFQLVINCSGIGSVSLFGDPEQLIYRGHLLQIPNMPPLKNPINQKTVSYNITPEPGTLLPSNKPVDIYCYPRNDGWIFGGSRQLGKLDDKGNWQSLENDNRTEFPSYIYEGNKEIVENSFGVKIKNPEMKQKTGYRYFRSTENGLQLFAQEMGDKLIIHNYGHGGAGVTLSWGCARKVLEMLE